MNSIEKLLRAGEEIKLDDHLTIRMFDIDRTDFCYVEYSNSLNKSKWISSGYISKYIKEIKKYQEVTQ
jgi:hypothetical protein